jgi:hypothetical protein
MLTVSPVLLRALLAAPHVGVGEGRERAGDLAAAPVQPSFALVAAGYGFGPLRGQMRQPAKRQEKRRQGRQ